MNLKEVNQMHNNQSVSLFNFITRKEDYKPSYQDEDDYADAMRVENNLQISKDNPKSLNI